MLPVHKYQNRTNPSDIDEFWTTQNSINIQRTKFEGDLVNGLSTGSSQTIISEGTTVGSAPPAVPLPAPPSVTFSSRILDGVQLALDIGGLAPVVGEACDATNVLIHVARGNKAEALISLAAMIPVAGAAVVSGKFATKAGKALANNADKLGEIAAAVNAPKGGLRARMGDPPLGMIKPQAHHDLPQAERFRSHWERTGLDIDDPAFGRWVEGGPVGNHQKWSKAFNDEWDAFFDQFPEATRNQILDHMNTLRIDPRFQ